MYKLPEDERQKALSAINRKQYQTKPLLAESVYNKANAYQVMMEGGNEILGKPISFVAVKGIKTWAVFYAYGKLSKNYIASNGHKANADQVQKWMDAEGDLMEHYRS